MRIACRSLLSAAAALALFGGDLATLSLAPAAASAQGRGGGFRGGGGFHGGGYGGGFRGGGFGGYRGGYGYGGYGYRGYGGFGFGGCCYGGYYGGFGFGDALLGAAVIGGTAAIIASNDQPVYDAYPPVYPVYAPPVAVAPPEGYGYAPPPPPAGQPQAYQSTDPVEQCTRAAVSEAASRGDTGRVTKIDQVDGYQNGAHVTGTLEVHRASRNGAVENAHFTCTADYGQVTAFRFG